MPNLAGLCAVISYAAKSHRTEEFDQFQRHSLLKHWASMCRFKNVPEIVVEMKACRVCESDNLKSFDSFARTGHDKVRQILETPWRRKRYKKRKRLPQVEFVNAS